MVPQISKSAGRRTGQDHGRGGAPGEAAEGCAFQAAQAALRAGGGAEIPGYGARETVRCGFKPVHRDPVTVAPETGIAVVSLQYLEIGA
ncbi:MULTISPECIES: hypothetical protein [unclassified Roseibium]|uniref:hypothetical protein n=1 Tax=unclassified Roseibium TaxID=2629323 RepID=UPI00273E50D3|nr:MULTISPECIES: hypothetical protein [unclassified Roseibium]